MAPVIHCIAIDSAGAATVTWAIPNDTNNSFISYNIYTSKTRPAGYTNSANVSPDNQNSVTINSINASTVPYYFYTTTTSGTVSTSSDTAESIFLSVANGGGVALLKWTPMYTPNLSTFNGWYYIYREYKYTWTLLDSTKSLNYSDTITYCTAALKYRIVANDSTGCQSSSNWAGGTFQDNIASASPVMDSVSVGPGGNVEISWFPSSSQNVVGYYIYEYIANIWTVIDTVNGLNSTFYNLTGASPGTGSLSFRVAGFDSCNNVSPLDGAQKTIYLQQNPNPCSHNNELKWSAYVDEPPVTGGGKYNLYEYEIYSSINGAPFTLLTTCSDTLDYMDTGLRQSETICYFVVAVDSANHSITASSNIVCYQVTTPPPPKFDYMRVATVINNSTQNQVNWYIDTGAGIEENIIERTDAPGDKPVYVGTVTAAPHTVFYSFVDPSANPNIQSYTYKVFAQDSCNFITDSTQIGQTIYLTATGDNSGTNTLNWNAYADWGLGNVIRKYDIYRDEDGGPYSQITSVSGTTLSYTDNVSAIITGQGVFGYYVQAVEQGTPYNLPPDTSTSNIAIAYQDPRVYVPNAFNPKGVNKVFIPVGVFVDLQNYDFTIYDRWGQLIFETTDPTQGWDGTYHGKLVEEGVYIYHIQYTSGKGEYFNLRSWVMMLK